MKILVTTSLICLFFATHVSAEVIISEVMYDPAGSDSRQEWVELYNRGDQDALIDSDWRFWDGSRHTVSLHQGTSTVPVSGYAVIADNAESFLARYPEYQGTLFDSTIAITNSSSTVAIIPPEGEYETLFFNPSWGASGNGKSLERIDLLSGITLTNWRESYNDGGTPGRVNSVPPEDIPEPTVDYRGKLFINELLPNPIGDDTTGEWVELYNSSDEILVLEGLRLGDTSNHYPLTGQLASHQYLVVPRSQSGIALNNTSDHIVLTDAHSETIDQTDYSNAKEGKSWARNDESWDWTAEITMGETNRFPENKPPSASAQITADEYKVQKSIAFDATASRDPEGEDLAFFWDFGDGATSNRQTISHKYSSAGSYRVLLRVTDNSNQRAETSQTIIISDTESKKVSGENSTTKKVETQSNLDEEQKKDNEVIADGAVIITELLPNPTGSDNAEWIELYNVTESAIRLEDYKLDDSEGGSRPFVFPQGTVINAGQYQVWSRLATKIALNNDHDGARLLTPDDQVLFEVSYDKSFESQSYALNRDEDEWYWSEAPSPGSSNPRILGLSVETAELVSTSTTLEIEGDKSDVVGVVLVPPHTWYKQKMYILGVDDMTQVIEVYQYRGDFPTLQTGDVVAVRGDYDSANDLPRIKIVSSESLEKIDDASIPWPEAHQVGDIDESLIGTYQAVQGTIEKINKRTFVIKDELENTIPISLEAQADWSKVKLEKGLGVLVRGLITRSGANLVLRPVDASDIRLEQRVDNTIHTSTTTMTADYSTSTARRNEAAVPFVYGLPAVGLVVGYIVWRKRFSSV